MASGRGSGPSTIGGYRLGSEIASGGLGVVQLARLEGAGGFRRTVAIKRLHPHLAADPILATHFLDEARLASRVRHPNVVATLDVAKSESELFVAMEYVHGASFAELLAAAKEQGRRAPVPVVVAIMGGILRGLHAAHEAKGEDGVPLRLVHRDVSPQNILVGADGVARIADFGVAKARGRAVSTQDGTIKGKLAYMAPEQLCGGEVDARTDVFAAGVVLWEAITGRRLFAGDSEGETVMNVMTSAIVPPSRYADVETELERAIMRALEREPAHRFESAREMSKEIEVNGLLASPTTVAAWVEELASRTLSYRAERLAELEGDASSNTMSEKPIEPSPRSEIADAHDTRHRAPTRALVAVAIVALLTIGAFAFRATRSDQPSLPPEPIAETPSSTSVHPPPSEAPPSPAAEPQSLARPSAAPAPRGRTKASTKTSCKPPYSIDAHGRRIFKEECL